jgi:transforming growth factor-beta-induced protein
MKKYLVLALCLLLCVSLIYCAKKKEEAPKQEAVTTPGDIVDIATADGRFTTLVTALNAAGLVETLKGPGPFTVFAPTDSAFAKLPPGTVESLMKDVPTLKNILLYHVVPGKIMAADIVNMPKCASALGDTLKTTVMPDGSVMINDANVLITDIEAKNGVIHVIDKVLIPPKK